MSLHFLVSISYVWTFPSHIYIALLMQHWCVNWRFRSSPVILFYLFLSTLKHLSNIIILLLSPMQPQQSNTKVQCVFCLSKIKHGEEKILRCGHSFHKSCMDSWIELKKSTCPLCRDSTSFIDVIEEQETVAAHVGLEEVRREEIVVLLMAFAFNRCWILDLVTKLFGGWGE